MFILRLFTKIGLIGFVALCFMNPSLEDGMQEVDKRIKAEQSTMRASWGGITKVTGIDWLGKQAGIGDYELCRANLYAASLYVMREVGGTKQEDQLAVGFGVARRIWGEKLMEEGDISNQITNTLVRPAAASFNFTECKVFKKPGKIL